MMVIVHQWPSVNKINRLAIQAIMADSKAVLYVLTSFLLVVM